MPEVYNPAEAGNDEHHRQPVQHAERDVTAREHEPRAGGDEQRAAGHLRPAAPEARPAEALLRRHCLRQPGAEHEQADDAGALNGPEGVGVEVLRRDEAEMVQVEREMERRHPDDGAATQGVEPVEPSRRVRSL